MKAREISELSACRSAAAAIDNARAVPFDDRPQAGSVEASSVGVGATELDRRELTEEDMRRLVAAEMRELMQTAASLEGIRTDRSAELRAGAAALERVLN